jgi:hypothetical protein
MMRRQMAACQPICQYWAGVSRPDGPLAPVLDNVSGIYRNVTGLSVEMSGLVTQDVSGRPVNDVRWNRP